jgi:polyribonucleotide nucleotidyltransferase
MLELLQKYPEAGKVVKNHFLSRMLDSLNDDNLPDDFKEHVRAMGIDDDKVASMIGNAPRSLFDVFDDNELYIQIDGDNKTGWSWEVGSSVENSVCSSRKEAESKAVAESFKLLNEKLCQTGL